MQYPQFVFTTKNNTLEVHAEHEAKIPLHTKALRSIATDENRVLIELFIAAATDKHTSEDEPLRITGLETFRDLKFLSQLREHPQHTQANIPQETRLLELHIHEEELILAVNKKETQHLFGIDELWAYTENPLTIYELRVNHESTQTISNQCEELIPISFLKTHLEQYYPHAENLGRTKIPRKIPSKKVSPTPRIYLEEQDEELLLQLRFAYEEKEVLAGSNQELYTYRNETITHTTRDKETEDFFSIQFKTNNVQATRDGYTPKNNPYSWLVDDAEELLELGFEIYGKNNLLHFNAQKTVISISTHEQPDYLELRIHASAGEQNIPSHVIAEMLRAGQRYVKLADQSTAVIPQKYLDKLQHKLALLEKTPDGLKLHPAHTKLVEELEELAEEVQHTEAYTALKERLQEFTHIQQAELPENLSATLREYQQAGYDWLHFLNKHSFGGILADDMGLGKTLTCLAMLQWAYENNPQARFLVVVPTSLVDNWLAERNKFAQEMPVYTHYGTSRETKAENIPAGITITSYNTLRLDQELLASIQWEYAVLDESHAIKNPASKVAQATRTLNAKNKLAITGTPIENNVSELWSQMQFTNPGLLGSYEAFTTTYGEATTQEQETLKNLIKPFLLRRTKQQVAKDLPKKTILTQLCEMTDKQASLYEATKQHLQEEVRNELQQKGATNKIFLALLRLRQLANHPQLLTNNYHAESGKFEALFEKIQEAISEGHKILIFSSFTKILDLVEKQMQEHLYLRIDGSTKNRQALVEEFQTNKHVNAFLISLKAGGVGLTLTAADYVFIIDPWWNPQAEMQAIDRAHRIGQQKPVFVYKFITKNTVEEKIARLQESKLELANNLITTEESFVKQLTKEDLIGLFE
ncbi:MAG: DEAD/DEAH box helicase [Candidatus Woesearchaeota archaeon]